MYTFKTRVTNLTKHARQIPWLGIPSDWFRAGETRDIDGVYPLSCLSRKGQFEYEIEHGLAEVKLVTNMEVLPLEAPLPDQKKEPPKMKTPPPPKSPKPEPKKEEPKKEEPKKPEAPKAPKAEPHVLQDPLLRTIPEVRKDSGIMIKPAPTSVRDLADNPAEPKNLPPATPLFPDEKNKLATKPAVTVEFGDGMSSTVKEEEAKAEEKPKEEDVKAEEEQKADTPKEPKTRRRRSSEKGDKQPKPRKSSAKK